MIEAARYVVLVYVKFYRGSRMILKSKARHNRRNVSLVSCTIRIYYSPRYNVNTVSYDLHIAWLSPYAFLQTWKYDTYNIHTYIGISRCLGNI